MEWPKRARTADWENGVLALDREKQFEVPKLTAEIMERLAGYTLVGFHVKGYPVTDELLAPFAGHKSMVNFGVENGTLTDACFPVFSAMPKLRILLLTGNAGIDGSGLSALQGCKLDLLTLDHTGLDDAGLLQAASIPKLSHIWIDHTAVTYDGLLAVAGNNYIKPVAHVQFTKEQMEHFSQLQREKAKKPVQLDEQAASECRSVLSAFFAEMTEWEQYMEQVGFEDAAGCAPPAGDLGEVCERKSPVWAIGLWPSHTAPRAPTTGKNSLTRSRSLRTSSTSTPERKIPALTAAFS